MRIALICTITVFTLLWTAIISDGTTLILGIPTLTICAISVFIINWVAFIPSFIFQSEKYYDFIGMISCLISVGIALLAQNHQDARGLTLALLLTIWSLRLGVYLSIRISRTHSDSRFTNIKNNKISFFFAWTLQSTWVCITTSTALIAMSNSPIHSFDAITYLGLSLWGVGFSIECVADYQKNRYYQQENREDFFDCGLWAYCRHPNYLGEIILWSGIGLFVWSELTGLQHIALLSPMFVFFLLTRLSGVPLLEAAATKKHQNNEKYQHYKNNTNAILPTRKYQSQK